MHQHAKADGGVERRDRERPARARRLRANSIDESCIAVARVRATPSISLDASTPVTVRPALGERQRGASGARADIENAQSGHVPEKRRKHALLILEQDLADRPAEPLGVEARRHRGIGVGAIAVVVRIVVFRKHRV